MIRVNRTITLSQQAYIERIVDQFGMSDAHTHTNPVLVRDLSEPIDRTAPKALSPSNHELYRSLVGALLYAANITRIDISYSVGQLCRYTSKPYKHHLDAALRVLRYLRGTSSYCLSFGENSPDAEQISLEAYSDADWAGDEKTSRSTTGCVVRFNGDVMNWVSKKQSSVALSTAEAKYMALTESMKELLWYRSWISEVFERDVSLVLSIAIIKLQSSYLKMIPYMTDPNIVDFDNHFIRDEINKNRIRVVWAPTGEQQADILTKGLSTKIFCRLREILLAPDFC